MQVKQASFRALAVLTLALAISGSFALCNRFQELNPVNKYILPIAYQDSELWTKLLLPADEMLFLRPLWGFSMFIDYQFWGIHALGYHLTNFFLHAAAALLVWRLARRFFSGNWSLALAVVFALHPAANATMFIIDNRSDMLSAPLTLAALLLGVPGSCGRKGIWRRSASLLFFAAALASKEVAAALPALLLFYPEEYSAMRSRLKGKLRLVLPYLIVFAVYLAIRFYLFQGIGGYRHGEGHFEGVAPAIANFGDFISGLGGFSAFETRAAWLHGLFIAGFFLLALFLKDRTARFGFWWVLSTAFLPMTIRRMIVTHLCYARFLYLILPGFLLLTFSGLNSLLKRIPAFRTRRLAAAGLAAALLLGLGLSSGFTVRSLDSGRVRADSELVNQIAARYPELPPGTTLLVLRKPPRDDDPPGWSADDRRGKEVQGRIRKPMSLALFLIPQIYRELDIHYREARKIEKILPAPFLILDARGEELIEIQRKFDPVKP